VFVKAQSPGHHECGGKSRPSWQPLLPVIAWIRGIGCGRHRGIASLEDTREGQRDATARSDPVSHDGVAASGTRGTMALPYHEERYLSAT